MKQKISIIYEDNDILVVNKPAKLLTLPDRYRAHFPNLKAIFEKKYGKIFILHRLDKETSGIIIFAKNKEAHRHLSLQFENRTVVKKYRVLVNGRMEKDADEIDKPIAPNLAKAGQMKIAKNGKQAITHYKVIERLNNFTYAEAEIKTGRTHQIRVHFMSIGHPLAIDAIYGKREAFFLSEIKRHKYKPNRKSRVENPLMDRVSLHSAALTIQHPVTQEIMTFEAELPKDFRAMLRQLKNNA